MHGGGLRRFVIQYIKPMNTITIYETCISSSQLLYCLAFAIIPIQMMKKKLYQAFIAFVFFSYCFSSHLDKFLIESRKSESINSLFEKLTPCQLTIVTNPSFKYTVFISKNTDHTNFQSAL